MNLQRDAKQSYQRYLNSQKVNSLINKKLTFETKVIKKEFNPPPKNMRLITFREIIVSGQKINRQLHKKIDIKNINTYESMKSSMSSSDNNKRVSLSRLSPQNKKRPQSVNHRLNLMAKKSKGSPSPDKLFTTLSAYFSNNQTDHKRRNSLSDFHKVNKIKVHGFSPLARQHSHHINI